jgi:hypothetical protein
MRIGPLLVIAAVMVGSACASDAQSSDTTAVATTVPLPTDAGSNPIDPARLCVSTDPGWTPISIHRALSCPDGTSVSVRGIIIGGSGGSVLLCDSAAGGDDCLTIDRGVLPIDDNRTAVDQIFYTGTVSKGVLTVNSPPALEDGGSVVPSPLNRPSSPLRSG